jgi:hemolysin activation/secretion protein
MLSGIRRVWILREVMKKVFCGAMLLLLLLPCAAGSADLTRPDAGAIQKDTRDTLDYYRLEKKMREGKKPPTEAIENKTPAPAQEAPEGADQVIFVRKVVTDASEVLSSREIRGITEQYEGRKVSMGELFAAVEELNALYRKKSFITAKAVLPPQTVTDGIVRIRLVEGRVGQVRVEENKYTRTRYFTERMSLKSGDLFRTNALERDLQYFNLTNDVQLKAEIKPGDKFGTTDYILKAEEPRNYQVSLFTDNAGRETVGSNRAGMTLTDASLLGIRDQLSATGVWSEGTRALSASYSIPVTSIGTRLGVYYDYNSINVISGAYQNLDITGGASNYGFSVTQPIIVRSTFLVNGFAGMDFKESTTEFSGVQLFKTTVRTVKAGFDFQSYDAKGAWFSSHSVTRGLHVLGGDTTFYKYNLSVVRQQLLTRRVVALFRGTGQISDNKHLPSVEQFLIGGMATVRGYEEALLSGNDGYQVSAEVQFPLASWGTGTTGPEQVDKIKGLVFIDHGAAIPYKGSNESINRYDFLTSGGFGLLLNFSKYLTGRVVVGIPFDKRDESSGRDVRIHFYAQSLLF